MDLSREQKNNRDAVELHLFETEKLLDELEEISTRLDATLKVWPETQRTLDPAARKLKAILQKMEDIKSGLSKEWQEGFDRKWK